MWEGVRYQYYESSDGHILFMASEQAFWKNFCEGVGRMDLFEKWPGKTHRRPRARQHASSRPILRDIFRTQHDRRSGSTFADEHNTTIAPANTPQTVRRRPAVPGPVPVDRRTSEAGADKLLFPLHVEGEELPVPTKAPEVGEHTDEVLRDVLGYDDDQAHAVRATGALG